jgi:nitroreductase
VDEALSLAQHAPSNSNIQPWRLVFASATARDGLKDALFRVADHEAPHIPALPKAFEHYRYELGAEVYGSMGITIADTARHAAAVMRNFDFFGAPFAGIVCMHRDFGPADDVSVGMYLQTLMLALTARGAGHMCGGLGGGVSRRGPNRAGDPSGAYDHLRLGRPL